MSHWKSKVKAEYIGDGNWRLLAPIIHEHDGFRLEVPPGFETDFGSIPRVLHPIFSPMGDNNAAYACHDYVYRTSSVDMTRLEADDMMLHMLWCSGEGYVKRYAIYWGVRAGGWASFKTRV